jgi:opacity protein-like surface antigen
MKRCVIAAAVVILVAAADATAQVTISGGLGWSGGYGIGDAAAQLRTNAPGSTPSPFTLFNVDSRITPSPGGELRVGVPVAARFTIEGGALFARRRLSFNIAGDPEAGAQEFAGESLQHYVFDAGVLWELPVARQSRARTFASAGAGYLRQLHQDRTLVESGQVYYLGGGARYWLRGRPNAGRSLGLRGDLRVNLRRNGIDFGNETRVYPTFSMLMFLAL